MILEDEIRTFLESDAKEYRIPMYPVSDIDTQLEDTFGFKREESEEDTNGWQVDFWYYYTKGDQRICVSGSLWYGDFKLTKE